MDIGRLESALEAARDRAAEAVKRLPDGGAEEMAAFSAAIAEQLEAERALAAARGEEFAVPLDLGVRWDPGAPLPHLLSSGHRSYLAFYLEEPDPAWDGTYVHVVDPTDDTHPASLALAEFKDCVAVKLGPPNDEVLHGHPLHGRGLGSYGAYVVENSRWLAELIEINRVHVRFDEERWKDVRHFLLVFHDETVEAIASGIDVQASRKSMPTLLRETIARL